MERMDILSGIAWNKGYYICICRKILVSLHTDTNVFAVLYWLMFELLLLIYLLPLVAVALLLFRLAVWLVRKTCRLVFWLAGKLLRILGRLVVAAFVLVAGRKAFTRRCK